VSLFDQYIKGFTQYLILERGFSRNTSEAYLRDCKKLFSFLDESYPHLSVKDITYSHLQEFITQINNQVAKTTNEDETVLKIASQKRLISGIRSFFKYLILEDEIAIDPTEKIELPRMDERLPVVLSNAEIDQMQAAIDRSTYKGEWTNLLIEILYGAGLRISEALNLKKKDLYPQEGLIHVIGKGDKERWVPLHKEAFRLAGLFWENSRSHVLPTKGNEEYIFLNHNGGHLTRIATFQAIKELGAKAGIKKNIHPHTLRHSFATELMFAGADIMSVKELMGHASVQSTQIYTNLDTEHLQETLALYHPLYKNNIVDKGHKS
jgi:Site-specific recombinase XerD